jgi:hypothetical protein
MCCSRFFRMLGFDQSYTNIRFPIGWSPYSSWCNGTCRDRYLSLLGCTIGYMCDVTWSRLITCLTFQKSCGAILSSNTIFLDGPIKWTRIYFASNRCSFGCCVSTSSLLCRSSNKGLVISSSYQPFILFILCPFSYNTPYSFRYTTFLQFRMFHNASVVIPLMIWVFICYVAHVGVSTLQPMICFKILLKLSH